VREEDHLEDVGVDGRIILQWILKKMSCRGMELIALAQIGIGGGLVMNFRAP